MLKDDILALGKLKRNSRNFTKVQDKLSELSELSEGASEALSALYSAREALNELSGALEDADNAFLPWADKLLDKISEFMEEFPEEFEEDIADLITEAEGHAEEYESCLDDKSYSAEDKDNVWGELLDAMENIGNAL